MGDILLIRELQRLAIRFDPPEETIRPWSPLLLALLDYPFRTGLGAYTVVGAEQAGSVPSGFAQARLRSGMPEWDIVSMAPSLGTTHTDAADTWERLLHHVVELAGSHGVQRVFVSAEPTGPAKDVFSRCAFAGYAREHIWAITDAVRVGTAFPAARPRTRRLMDTWALHQLYLHATPTEVQASEGKPVLGLSSGIRLNRWHLTREYVWEERGQISGYLAVSKGPRGVALCPLVDPGTPDLAAQVLAWGVSIALSKRPELPIYCVTRRYDQVTAPWLHENGTQISERLLMVKQLAVRVREPVLRLEPSLDGRVNTAVTRTCDEYKPGQA